MKIRKLNKGLFLLLALMMVFVQASFTVIAMEEVYEGQNEGTEASGESYEEEYEPEELQAASATSCHTHSYTTVTAHSGNNPCTIYVYKACAYSYCSYYEVQSSTSCTIHQTSIHTHSNSCYSGTCAFLYWYDTGVGVCTSWGQHGPCTGSRAVKVCGY